MRRAGPGGRVLLILLLAYIFNFIDRQIIGVLALPIKAELGLSDKQLGLMGGIAFALFYSGLAIPIAWLADRRSRVRIIAASVALWSLFTAACGFAQNFWQLFLARMGVGIGEAGGVAPSYALISDFYPKEKRARALAFFSLGIPIGSALGVFFGGWIASHLDWRSAFLIVGLAGLPAALLVQALHPRAGARRLRRAGAERGRRRPSSRSRRRWRATPSFWLLSFGAASGSILGYGLIFWLPSFFARSFHLALAEVGWYLRLDRAGRRRRRHLARRLVRRPHRARRSRRLRAASRLSASSIAAPCFALGLFAPILWLGWLLFAIGQMLALAWLGPVIAAVQHIVPPNMRATASASFLFINNLIGIGFGIFFLGFMSDAMKAAHGEDALQIFDPLRPRLLPAQRGHLFRRGRG